MKVLLVREPPTYELIFLLVFKLKRQKMCIYIQAQNIDKEINNGESLRGHKRLCVVSKPQIKYNLNCHIIKITTTHSGNSTAKG